MNHYDEMTFLQYLEGNLERAVAVELSSHTQHCDACRMLLGALQRETHLLSHALREEDEAVPARLLNPERARVSWAWVVSFAMAAAGIYYMWTSYVDPASTELTQAGFNSPNLMSTIFVNGALWKGWTTMWTAVQALAVLSLGVIGFVLVRRSLRRWNTIALVMSALVAALGFPMGAGAAEIHHSDATYTLPAGQTVKTDLIVFGNAVRIDGNVEGDVIAFGQTVRINGHVSGDVIAFGNMLNINGTVDGSVRYGGGNYIQHGKVGKNAMVGAGNITTDGTSEIGWGLTCGGGEVNLDGRIGRDILCTTGRMTLNGFVGGNIKLNASHAFDIVASAEVLGKIEFKGPKQAEVASGAKLASPVQFTLMKKEMDTWAGFSWWHKLLAWGASFVFGLMLVLLVPAFFDDTVRNANRVGVSLGLGLLLIVGMLVAAVLACITVVGLAVGLTTIMLWIVMIYGVKVFVAAWLGRLLMGKDGFAGVMIGVSGHRIIKTPAILGHLAVGLLILYAIRLIPYVGIWTALAAIVWGFGAVGYTVFKRIASRGAVPEVAAAAPVTV